MSVYDVLIVGGGPAGLTAGLYAARADLKTAMLERLMPGGQVAATDWVENYPGFVEGISGADLTQKMEKQARRFGLEIISVMIDKADLHKNPKIIHAGENKYEGRTVIFATGNDPKLLDVPGEKEFKGRGVSYCATCDGPFFKDKDIVVVGGGSSGVQESLYLTRFVRSIKLVEFMDHLNAEKILQKRAHDDPKFSFYLNHRVLSINGSQKVESVTVKDRQTGKEKSLEADGVFIWIGMLPNSDFLKGQVDMNRWGFIITDDAMQTSIPGVYAAGDVRDKTVRQITTAVADGTIAAESALHFLESGGKD
ncbi:MAG TPA: thioredoxin-disulfide reductase [bacterium]|nr:thioredoxin-disulfide reductase [bacterium]